MKRTVLLLLAVNAAPALAEDTRQLDAHEHGVGALNIAIDGTTVAMEFHAPGADIVGFEYAAESEADRAAVDAAVATLARPLDLFVLPAAAACSVTQASAELESEQAHDDHDHDAHKDHDDHAEHSGHEDHAEHSDHTEHAEEAGHSEFHAEYTLTCADPTALTEISFAYFDTFENARELEVQVIAGSGAQAFEVERDAPTLGLRSLF
ncbi:DUF2796 domain-containing protein [uncultured Roseobacter sp.]|uniref:zinc uptake protein ZrgA n=1 Tax=uncultured Roseobacter sp. TaxID=114847 RepID=UPI00263118F8|nr:DUF2796 domain-containing protein [uncultured Roseobacter sp.]